jgi:hypothetical protein
MRAQAHCCVLITLVLGALQIGACSRTGLLSGDEESPGCTPGKVALTRASPTVMFVLDRSASMDNRLVEENWNSPRRWVALTNGLESTLTSIESNVRIGALLFPSNDTICGVDTEVSLAPEFNNAERLIALMHMPENAPGGGTPTAAAIDVAATALLGMRTSKQARALVLATDGVPDCNDQLDPADCRCTEPDGTCHDAPQCLDDYATNQRIEYYASKQIPTYVLGLQSESEGTNAKRWNAMAADVLNAMAQKGGRPQTNSAQKYYAARSEAELNNALSAISGLVGACLYLTLSVPNAGGTIQLTLDGEPLSDTDWQWHDKSNGEIAFGADVCAQLQSEQSPQLTANVTCGHQ